MVAGLTAGRKKYAAVDAEAQAALTEAENLRLELTAAIDEDAAAFQQVMAVWRNKEMDELAKAVAVEQATIGAGEVPLRVARLSRDAANLAQQMAQIGNANAVSDAAAGAIMAHAAVQAAALNVKINGVGLQDRNLAQMWTEEVDALEAETAVIVQNVKQTVAERGGFS
jgi:glutamate formiminotransferase/formiminotetrahydrofolate cyclodeaminase